VLLLPRPALMKLSAFAYLSSQYISLVPDDEHRRVIHDSVSGGMRCGCYGDGFRRSLRNGRRFSRAHYVNQQCTSPESDKEHVKCIVHRIPNDFRIADST
jgi:hypothetical protein